MRRYADKRSEREAGLLRRIGSVLALVFWTVELAEIASMASLEDPANAKARLSARLIVFVIGMSVTTVLVEAVIVVRGKPFQVRAAIGVTAALTGCAVTSYAHNEIFRAMIPQIVGQIPLIQDLFFQWSWFYLSLAGALLSLSYSYDVRDRDTRLMELQAAAHQSQLRALRYQLNPHFLFNTLNSIAALIAKGDNAVAEHMVESLSDFLRTGLELDPLDDISLEQEIRLQKIYLDIETLRFPERLNLSIDLPGELRRALVPSLITQPLIENAIKYSVARSESAVTLAISASTTAGVLILMVSDEGCDCGLPAPPGAGIGLKNVVDRLHGSFGPDAALDTTENDVGGFTVTLRMPLRFSK